MSSPSKKPYQSRLINLINRYYININSQFRVKLRELGYVIQGGLQKAVVPFLWLWQSGNKIGQSFSSSPNSNSSRLPEGDLLAAALRSRAKHATLSDRSSADTNEENQLIETLHQNIARHPLFNSLSTQNWQGLATRLKDKQIVVITTHNKVKNLIPSVKQDDLKFIINQTLSNYHKKQKKSFLEIARTKFNDLLTTKKKGEIILSNYSQDSNKQLVKSSNDKLFSPNFAKKEYPIVQEIIGTSQQKLKEIIPIVQETTSNLVVRGVNQLQSATHSLNKTIEEDPFQIRLLIIEAINYFLKQPNNQQNNKLLQLLRKNQFLTNFTQTEINIFQEQNTEPWLSWEDLYKQPKSLSPEDISELEILIEPEEKVILDELPSYTEEHQDSSQKLTPSQISSYSPTTTITVTPSPKTKKVVVKHQQKVAQTAQSSEIEVRKQTVKPTVQTSQTEAIEAKVIEIKYEKHFLEIVLEKLDQLIVWLEEKLIKLISIIR